MMSARGLRSGTWRIAASAIVAASTSIACLTEGQVRSVQSQVREIRREVDRVAAVREQQLSALTPAPRESHEPKRTGDRPGEPPPLPEPSPPGTVSGSAASREAERLYREGYALYHRGEFAAAESSLRRSLALRPEGEEGATARLLIAGSLAARGRDREAIDALQPLIDLGRPPALAARALYERALRLQRLGRPEEARQDLMALLEKFPESDVAPLARARLEAP
jgi:TolA-binding protein